MEIVQFNFSNFLGDRQQRSVLNFTFRDSTKDFVNVAYWLPPKDLAIVSSKFTIGDVGKLPYRIHKPSELVESQIFVKII